MALKRVWLLFLFLQLLALDYLTVYATATREVVMMNSKEELAARLERNGDLVDCWSSMMELRSCSNEIVLFFINGNADIGPDCCRAIAVITHNCWPAMLTSLGFTAQEGDILRGYCDAAASPPALPPYRTS